MPQHDVLIVGGGFAGLRAALGARAAGADVAILSKVHPMRSHSSGAHSGINAALKSGDSWEAHAKDTIAAGGDLSDPSAVEVMCQSAAEDVVALEHMGVIFNRDGEGRIDVTTFPGSSQARTAFVGDSAGHVILQVLFEQVVRNEIRIYDEWFAASLLVEDGMCKGVIARDLRTGELHPFHAKATVMATGNLGQMYNGGTCSLTGTGDGVALAYRAGVPLIDMEMVQYHPTTLADRGILITEGTRAEGAHLVNKKGERFMERYDADSMEMSTRDVVARAAQTEVRKNRGDKGHVFLDMRHLDKARMTDRLQETLWIMDDLEGLDPSEDLIPVKPGMHRPLGGIKIDTFGDTGVPGLYAAGECASTGAHGANRLGGNSLLDCIVFGRRAGESASRYVRGATWRPASADMVREQEEMLDEVTAKDANSDTAGAIRRDLGEIMDKNVGMVRNLRGLRKAANAVAKLQERHGALGVRDKSGAYNVELRTIREVGNLLDVAQVIIASAEARQESRGCHFRSDFEERDDKNWMKRTVATHSEDGPSLDYEPVETG